MALLIIGRPCHILLCIGGFSFDLVSSPFSQHMSSSLVSLENLKAIGSSFLVYYLGAQSCLIAGNIFYSQLKRPQLLGKALLAQGASAHSRRQKSQQELREEEALLCSVGRGKSRGRASSVRKQGRRPPTCFHSSGKCLTVCLPCL